MRGVRGDFREKFGGPGHKLVRWGEGEWGHLLSGETGKCASVL